MSARACCAETDISCGNAELGGLGERTNHVVGSRIPPKPYSIEPTVSAKSFLWSRNLSSQAGTKSSNGEDELEDGFSDLETPPESGKVEDVIENHADVSPEGGISEEELDDTVEGGLGLSDVETDSTGEKVESKRSEVLPLIRILMETGRGSISAALDKWVSDGKSLGRSEISLVMVTLRRRRFWGKTLQVHILS